MLVRSGRGEAGIRRQRLRSKIVWMTGGDHERLFTGKFTA
jgi:hypothetical protein